MKRFKKLCVLGLIMGFSLFSSLALQSHMMWLNVTDFYPEFYPRHGASTERYFGWGHRYPVDDFLDQKMLKEFYFVCPRCRKHHTLVPNPGGFLATTINFEEPGAYIVAAVLEPGFYTMYIEKGEMHHKMGPKTGHKAVIVSLYYEQYIKALIMTGTEDRDAYKNPIGHKIEIVPMKDPGTLKVGDFLPVQVLFNGRPASFCKVFAKYSGFSTGEDFAYTTSTDGKGIARIRILHYGPWLLKTEKRFPATKEFEDKCNELHYTATFTFEVP